MKNRKIMEFVIYPRQFHALSILYKGVYCLSFKIYHVYEDAKTYGFPFILPNPVAEMSTDRHYEEPSVHVESNFSYQTQRFYMIYEEDVKKMRSQCIFRLQYDYNKEYNTYIACKLLKKQKKDKKEESNFCTRSIEENKFEILETQTIKINHINRLNHYLRVYFHSSEFFSAVDLRICSFCYGVKAFKDKKQLSDILTGYDLAKCNPALVLKARKEKKEIREKDSKQSLPNVKEVGNEVVFAYNQLSNILDQYCKWRSQVVHFRDNVLAQYDSSGRKLAPLKLQKLDQLNREPSLSESEIRRIYTQQRVEDTLTAILEEQELLRCNIRALREYYCVLLFHEPERKFKEEIRKSVNEEQKLRQSAYVCLNATKVELIKGQLRNRASQDFEGNLVFSPLKIERIPYLLVEGYSPPLPTGRSIRKSLTVFVHGYQGNSFDFQKSKNYIKKHNKTTTVLIAESITQQMDRSILELGKKVASEVVKHVENSLEHFDQINFVGFSLGGLLVRACLADLGTLRNRLGLFVTFSSPHLGISQSQNSLVNLGVWYLIKMEKVKNLKQLNFQSTKLDDSVLMKLSQCPYISCFQRVILVSSKDDGFVPLYSTFLERDLCQNQIATLCDNMRSKIRRLERVEVLFNVDHANTLDKLTGRRGHIEFLDNHYFLELFFKIYGPFF